VAAALHRGRLATLQSVLPKSRRQVFAKKDVYQVTVEKTAETSDFVTYWIRITAVSTTATVAGNPG